MESSESGVKTVVPLEQLFQVLDYMYFVSLFSSHVLRKPWRIMRRKYI